MTRTRQIWLLVICLGAFFVLGQQWAMRGTHMPTGNVGFLGTDVAGVQGTGVNYGVWADGTGSDGTGVGGRGYYGIYGSATSGGIGVIADGATAISGFGSENGVYGTASSELSNGVWGNAGSVNGAAGIYGSGTPPAYAAWFDGPVTVVGTLTKSAGSFKIDHPLYPAERYLSHSFVESPDMKNIYDGIVTLEADGSAVVELPEWFDALNKDFRYQLTCIGENAPVYVADEIAENKFRIGGGYAGMKISWMVTGIRRDIYAETHRIQVEELKAPRERGRYLHPELYGQAHAQAVMLRQSAPAGTPLRRHGMRR